MGVSATLILDEEELWKLHTLVAYKAEALDRAELEAMSALGGQPWRDLQEKLKGALRETLRYS